MITSCDRFVRYIGIDYSGAKTAEDSLNGLRVYQAGLGEDPQEVLPSTGRKKYWSRRGLAEWLCQELASDTPTIVGIDHAFSFPIRYFERYALALNWPSFLEDFCAHWPTDAPNTYVDFVRDGVVGNGRARIGNRRWRRKTEEATGSAKSVFHFDVQGSVAKSTHSGIPWLRYIRRNCPQAHFWPFDGWAPAKGASVIAEVYPRLWNREFPSDGRTADQHDAYCVTRWLQDTDRNGRIEEALTAPTPQKIADLGRVEGWILGAEWPPVETQRTKKRPARTTAAPTTELGFINRNNQKVMLKTDILGNDHNQVVYVLQCQNCGSQYGANGSDIFQRRCPSCDGGRPGLPTGSI